MKPEQLQGLRTAAETKFGSPLKVHTDFSEFSQALKGALSPSTIKRIWSYNKDHQSISTKSINILAQYLGYENYEDFINANSLDTDQHKQLYAASKIAMLAERVHSDRFNLCLNLFEKGEYSDMLSTLESIDDECEMLAKSAEPFIDSVKYVIAEMCIKAMAVWCCNYKQEGTINIINDIFERAIPLAKSINDHYSLWFIYQNWALWSYLGEDADKALEIYELSITQGKILQLESPEELPNELVMVMNDKAFLLSELERYPEALEIVEDALNFECEPLFKSYLQLNYAKICVGLEREDDCIKIYKDIIAIIDGLHKDEKPTNESVKLLAFANFNLGVHYQEIVAQPDAVLARKYLTEAVKTFESRDVPTPEYEYYYNCAVERLKVLQVG